MLYAVPIVGVTEGTAVKHATCTENKQYLSLIFFWLSPDTPAAAAPPPPPSLGDKGGKMFFFNKNFVSTLTIEFVNCSFSSGIYNKSVTSVIGVGYTIFTPI